MISQLPKQAVRNARRLVSSLRRRRNARRESAILRTLRGVIHVGANTGQERDLYLEHQLNVLWVEPIPMVFDELQKGISSYPRQRAINYLILDRDGESRTLHVSNNEGLSSSVMDLAEHRDVWPSVDFTTDLELVGYQLDTALQREGVNLADYDGLVLDTQGAELMVLQGADRVLKRVRVVKAEVADFEAYAGCPRPADLYGLLSAYGFNESSRIAFARHPAGGQYFDITYVKNQANG